jgi:isocitrate dehydrogenase kinase/phosphatase
MQVFYSIFDRDNNQVGLVHAHHEHKEQIAIWDRMGRLADTVVVDQLWEEFKLEKLNLYSQISA